MKSKPVFYVSSSPSKRCVSDVDSESPTSEIGYSKYRSSQINYSKYIDIHVCVMCC